MGAESHIVRATYPDIVRVTYKKRDLETISDIVGAAAIVRGRWTRESSLELAAAQVQCYCPLK
jgi:hypothetical protein